MRNLNLQYPICFIFFFKILIPVSANNYMMFSISSEGDEWLKMRSALRQLIMRPKDVTVFSPDVNAVVTDLVERVRTLRSQQDDRQTVFNINDLFFKYAMEGEPEGTVHFKMCHWIFVVNSSCVLKVNWSDILSFML